MVTWEVGDCHKGTTSSVGHVGLPQRHSDPQQYNHGKLCTLSHAGVVKIEIKNFLVKMALVLVRSDDFKDFWSRGPGSIRRRMVTSSTNCQNGWKSRNTKITER